MLYVVVATANHDITHGGKEILVNIVLINNDVELAIVQANQYIRSCTLMEEATKNPLAYSVDYYIRLVEFNNRQVCL
jgi:hypothetical protein